MYLKKYRILTSCFMYYMNLIIFNNFQFITYINYDLKNEEIVPTIINDQTGCGFGLGSNMVSSNLGNC